MARKRLSEREVIATLIHQGIEIRCFRTGTLITLENVNQLEREHLHEHALDGPDVPGISRYSLKEAHKIVTYGTPATKAGSSRHRIGKTRANHTEKFRVEKTPLDAGMDKPVERCRSCGEYQDDSCRCPKRIEISPLAGKRSRERALARLK